jgi:hypothetical protein
LRFVDTSIDTSSRSLPRPTARLAVGTVPLASVVLAAFILWLPLQTPVALVVFQYGHSIPLARMLLLVKDVVAAVMILALLARYWRRIEFYWFDWAAVVYLAMMVVYSVVPWALGSDITFLSVVTTARDYVVPAELYALGRLAIASGIDARRMVRWFMAVAALAAVYTVAMDLLPAKFWATTMNIVEFVKQVQGIPVGTLYDVSITATFGSTFQVFTRAIGPFTHPVGTGTYFLLPLSLSVAWCFEALNTGRTRQTIGLVALSLLFAAAVITPISRGSWLGAGFAVLVLALIYRRPAFSIAAVALTGAVLLSTVPYKYAITSAVDQTDSSTQDHAAAIGKATTAVSTSPVGSGVGQADQFGQVFAGGEGVGENMYLALWVSVGPIGLLAFLVFMAGLLWRLAAVRLRAPPPSWITLGSGAGLLGLAASAMTSSTPMRFTTAGTIWLVFGMAVAYAATTSGSRRDAAASGGDASGSGRFGLGRLGLRLPLRRSAASADPGEETSAQTAPGA